MNRKRFKVSLFLLFLITILGFLLFPYYQFVGRVTGRSPIALLLLNNHFKKTNNTVNILLLGKAGGNNDGPNLTDSITVASYNLNTKKVYLISIPRDIWSQTLNEKINAAYAFGEAKKAGGGMILSSAEIGSVVDLPIHYAIVIDFEKFQTIIDSVGGVDVDVTHSFVDNKYPRPGKENDTCNGDPEYLCRYETISFQAGMHHMNGETALKFARSRNAEGDEGSDFARSARQQKIFQSLRVKAQQIAKSGNLKKIEALYNSFDRAIERNIKNDEVAFLAKKIVFSGGIHEITVPLPEDLFIVPNVTDYYGKYVLIPATGNFDRIHEYVKCALLDKEICLQS
ncbi:hypothetical protein A3D80_03220 [Candidatus Roizmanbacteria bacterium RIFCSPHIGHO2_02_FULL_40_13b]|uniref:Cell envelope-related transcriptional attenuator domain-containing protein n=1 Tax=Candidatus Roizmanbacteria bacterium RIFCSPHIGHO2_01_FULL_39_24 TaxID=1802032 RepID=A0A1F7GML9_9BACT|nr:MAG: hypothetical protein A2799_00965 [Candidatus Roizmanbacteria bacterium RIFCSPHIGHO2_01_FULL_39_24]OGK26978.1 MAG: hypothetical protein A3D80_03220 [Candidatus Roizmanbacteria bacterium RIFCSPHIGHO2_02_FULL_40_13b]OGK48867.1 MAG: hypothetical protein A3A56_01505 [Candidatus Roizmanbacteria bacterium RIFCSPLOWO2_01_FULL_40_32]OGK57175.1 MAG: hypothetical protein A3H83_00770 [Candidatus Roizmanbacteria bacterium RIFCSPLOWO2_02_FULL_39_8]